MFCLQQFEKLFETEYYGVVDKKTNACEFGAFYVEASRDGRLCCAAEGIFLRPEEDSSTGTISSLWTTRSRWDFYRTGKFWRWNISMSSPTSSSSGKSLTNGMNPISAYGQRRNSYPPKVFGPGSTHSTFSSNPLGTTTGLATMKLMEENDFATEVPKKGKYFISKLRALRKKYPQIGDVDGLGLALRIEMCQKDGYTPNKALTDAIEEIGLSGHALGRREEAGARARRGGYYKNVFTLAPSLFITEKEIDLGVELFEEALSRAIRETLLTMIARLVDEAICSPAATAAGTPCEA